MSSASLRRRIALLEARLPAPAAPLSTAELRRRTAACMAILRSIPEAERLAEVDPLAIDVKAELAGEGRPELDEHRTGGFAP